MSVINYEAYSIPHVLLVTNAIWNHNFFSLIYMNMYICYSGLSCIFNLNILLSLISQYILYYKQMYECREIQVKNVTRDYKPALESRTRYCNEVCQRQA